MRGTEKQVKWAESIKASKDFSFFVGKGRDERSNAVIAKAVEFIGGIDNAAFWIDSRESSAMDLLRDLMGPGLEIKGIGFDDLAKMAPDGTITITWREIVQDGKGGSWAIRSKTL